MSQLPEFKSGLNHIPVVVIHRHDIHLPRFSFLAFEMGIKTEITLQDHCIS